MRNALSRSHTKRRKLQIPDKVTIDISKNSITVEELSTLSSFVRNIHRVSLPAQVGCVLRDDGMVKRILVNRPGKMAWARLNTWIASSLYDELEAVDGDQGEVLGEILERACDLCYYTTEILVSVEDFLLSKYLKVWDGKHNRSIVFKLLLLIKIRIWQDLDNEVISPLSNLCLSAGAAYRSEFLIFLTELVSVYAFTHGPLQSIKTFDTGLSRIEVAQVVSGLYSQWSSLLRAEEDISVRSSCIYMDRAISLWI